MRRVGGMVDSGVADGVLIVLLMAVVVGVFFVITEMPVWGDSTNEHKMLITIQRNRQQRDNNPQSRHG